MRRSSQQCCCALSKPAASRRSSGGRAVPGGAQPTPGARATATQPRPAEHTGQKQGSIDAAKLRPHPAAPNSRRLDVDVILGRLRLRLRLPRRQRMLLMERRSVIDCMKDCLVPSRRWDGLSSSDDEAPSPAPTRASRAAEPGAAGSEERSRRAGSSRGGGKGGALAALAVLRTAARTGCGAAVLWWCTLCLPTAAIPS